MLKYTSIDLPNSERMARRWTASVYAFFDADVKVEHNKEGRRMHAFKCSRPGCELKRPIYRYLDTGDATSTSNLRAHVISCWGEEVLKAADGWSKEDKKTGREKVTELGLSGTLTEAFKRVPGSKRTYSVRPLTPAQIRCVHQSRRMISTHQLIGFIMFYGVQGASVRSTSSRTRTMPS